MIENRPPHALFGVRIHPVKMCEAIDQIFSWFASESHDCHYVVTPNVNHVVALESDSHLRKAYHSASLVIADGWPVIAAARLLGVRLPERVAGSDLVPNVLNAACDRERPITAFLLGGMPGVAERASECIERKCPNVRVCGIYSPEMGFEDDPKEQARMLDEINKVKPDFLIVGLGAPKQEIWLSQNRDSIHAKVAIAAGATIDFLAGEQTRAPKLVRWVGMEWLFRIGTNPSRLAGRYLRDGFHFPRLIAQEFVNRGRSSGGA